MTAARRRAAPDHAGLRYWAQARSTRTHVGVYDGVAAQMDAAAGRWQTVCEEHGWIVSHRTLELARGHASHPDDWCGYCSGEFTEPSPAAR